MIRTIRLLKAIGQFDSVCAGADVELQKLTLVYAENARGKTTVAAVMRSLATGDAIHIQERRRLGAACAPEAVVDCAGGSSPACFQQGVWSRSCADILIFDDDFVDRNVYSGMTVAAAHRQNLHDLILGEQGVALARDVDEIAAEIREINRELREAQAAIPPAEMHGLQADEFCALEATPELDAAIAESEQRLAAQQSEAAVRSTPVFEILTIPPIDADEITRLLGRTVSDLDQQAAESVRAHLQQLGRGAEEWVGRGMRLCGEEEHRSATGCPFCGQSLAGSALFNQYRAFFGDAYRRLQTDLAASRSALESTLSGDALAGFQRQLRTLEERRRFWAQFVAAPEVDLDAATIAAAWQTARDAALDALRAKLADPLSARSFSPAEQASIDRFREAADRVARTSESLQRVNTDIQRVKESVRGGSEATARTELNRLRAAKARHTPAIDTLCRAWLEKAAAKQAAEAAKSVAQARLDQYRQAAFPNWETEINGLLARLGAGFTVVRVESQPTPGRPSCVYKLLVNGHEVPVGANSGAAGSHSFKTTLSAGDRNTLALALFLAAIKRDPDRSRRIVILDDPMSSLDRNRRLATIQEIRGLMLEVAQVIVMSHDERFLFDLYDRAARRDGQGRVVEAATLCITRVANGSTVAPWDLEQEKLDQHDKRHAMFEQYLGEGTGDRQKLAQAIRPHLECFLRTAYPGDFREGETLREFRNRVRASLQNGRPIMSESRLAELDAILEYANNPHHATNAEDDTARVNDAELRTWIERMQRFPKQ